MNELYPVGSMVVAISKTPGDGWNRSNILKEARARGQRYLYVTKVCPGSTVSRFYTDRLIYVADVDPDSDSGDYFFESDLMPFLSADDFYKEIGVLA